MRTEHKSEVQVRHGSVGAMVRCAQSEESDESYQTGVSVWLGSECEVEESERHDRDRSCVRRWITVQLLRSVNAYTKQPIVLDTV